MYIWIAIILLTILLDQLTKYLTVLYLQPIDTLPIIKDVLHLTYVENPGAAFGMMKDARWLFMTVSTVAIIGLLVYLFVKKSHNKLENTALCFIIGGGIGNMIDRITLEYVVDMIDFRLINFAVFNVADSFVCVGAGMLMLYLIMEAVKEAKAQKAALVEGEETSPMDAEADTDAEAEVAEESTLDEETIDEGAPQESQEQTTEEDTHE